MRVSPRRRSRELAMQGIYQWIYTGASAGTVLKNLSELEHYESADADFLGNQVERHFPMRRKIGKCRHVVFDKHPPTAAPAIFQVDLDQFGEELRPLLGTLRGEKIGQLRLRLPLPGGFELLKNLLLRQPGGAHRQSGVGRELHEAIPHRLAADCCTLASTRCTVRVVTPNAPAVSSSVSPPK